MMQFSRLEPVTRVTPLGVRFWDLTCNLPIEDGLIVSAYPLGQPQRFKRSLLNPSGIHLLQNLDGLRDLESGAGDKRYWDDLKPDKKRDFVLEVEDTLGRFLPFACRIQAPIHGLMRLQDVLPLEPGNVAALDPAQLGLGADAMLLPLFSSPARRTPNGMTAIRASLRENIHKPAAWASLEVNLGNAPPILARGFADANGQLLILMPYPTLPNLTKPPPLGQQSWTLGIQARYTPVKTIASLNARALPDLYHLYQQKPSGSSSPVTLQFGHELNLHLPEIAPAI